MFFLRKLLFIASMATLLGSCWSVSSKQDTPREINESDKECVPLSEVTIMGKSVSNLTFQFWAEKKGIQPTEISSPEFCYCQGSELIQYFFQDGVTVYYGDSEYCSIEIDFERYADNATFKDLVVHSSTTIWDFKNKFTKSISRQDIIDSFTAVTLRFPICCTCGRENDDYWEIYFEGGILKSIIHSMPC